MAKTIERALAQAGVSPRPALMTAPEAADYLALSPHTVRIWAQQGKLPCVKLGASLRFRREDLDAYVESNRREAVAS